MKKTRLIAALLLLAQVGISCAQTSKITVKVTDESDQIVTNANVSAGFRTKQKPGWGWGSGKASRVVGTTDGNGYCILEGSGDDNGVGVSVTKVGYYGSSKVFIFTNLNTFTKQWEPWNPTIGVLLKPIGIQVPMYKREIDQLKFPSEGKPVGFDLMVGDWVAPHGKGSVQDLIFQVE